MDKKYFLTRLVSLDRSYYDFRRDWRQLNYFFLPYQARFLTNEVNKTKSSKKIVDSTPILAVRDFSSGIMSGATSPARKWFRVGIAGFRKKQTSHSVKEWTAEVSELFRDIYNSSNIYMNFPILYQHLGVFGIAVMSLHENFDNVIRTNILPIGSYRIANNEEGVTDTLYRCYMESAINLYNRFGEENCSYSVVRAVKNEQHETLFEIVHAVEPNKDYIEGNQFAKNKKFISVYFEKAGDNDKFLSKSGFDMFPYLVMRATTNGEDTYPSTYPGKDALPDVMSLMTMQREKAKAIAKKVTPSLQGPASLKGKTLSDNPGAYNGVPDNTSTKISSLYQLDIDLTALKEDILDIRLMIGKHFYNDLFAMMTNSDRRQITAREIDERHEEKLVLLSPLLEHIHASLKYLIDWTFWAVTEAKILPPPPPEIQGKDIQVDFISTLAMAQQAATIGSIERWTTFVANLSATVDPNARMKLDINKIVDIYADIAGVDPDLVVSDEQVEAMKQVQAQQQAMANAMEMAKQGSEVAQNLGGVDATGANLRERLGI